jgi:hypothetical protein
MSGSFNINYNFSGPVGYVEEDFKDISYIKIGKNSFPYCGPTPPPGAMILTKLILYYVRKLSCKFQLFRASNTCEFFFK